MCGVADGVTICAAVADGDADAAGRTVAVERAVADAVGVGCGGGTVAVGAATVGNGVGVGATGVAGAWTIVATGTIGALVALAATLGVTASGPTAPGCMPPGGCVLRLLDTARALPGVPCNAQPESTLPVSSKPNRQGVQEGWCRRRLSIIPPSMPLPA